KAMPEYHHRRLHLRVVVRVVACEEGDAEPVERLEAGRGVGHALPDDARHDRREQPDAETARAGGPVAGRVRREARSDGDVGLPREDGRDETAELRRVVLAVAVDAYGEVVAVLEGEA